MRHLDCKLNEGSDDKVEENTLSSAFDITCRAWQDRFKISYSHCACPLPGDTIGRRLSRILSSTSAQRTAGATLLEPPNRPDLRVHAATHPSDHNSVFDSTPARHKSSLEARTRRMAKVEKRKAREAKKSRDRSTAQDPAHENAFLYPVPMFGGPIPAGGCVGDAHMHSRCGTAGGSGCAVVSDLSFCGRT